MAGKGLYLFIALAVLLADQITKGLIESRYALYSSHEIIPGFLNFTHVRNSGVAFGLFASQGDSNGGILVLSLLGIAALGFVGIYLWRTPTDERLLLLSLGLILGGAVGNLVDRIGSGEVTDFIDVYFGTYHWHTFNVADSAITVGIVLMIVDIVWQHRRESPSGAEA